jgi:hypothetical protein
VTYLKFGTGIEEHFVSSHSLLPFHQYGYTEEEMAQTAFIVTGVFVACGEDAGSVFLQQGIVTVDIERTVSPADSQVDSPMRVLLEVVIYGEDVEAEFP